jgi:hypothetical protein
MGGFVIFYAKQDGEKALAGSSDDKLSPTTGAWIYFNKSNTGATYPAVLAKMQFSVQHRCENVINSNKSVIFVRPDPKRYTNDEMLEELNEKIKECFFNPTEPKNEYEKRAQAFYSKLTSCLGEKVPFTSVFQDAFEE